jgi:hypothetical protein
MNVDKSGDDHLADGCLWLNVLILVVPILFIILAVLAFVSAWRK